MKKVTFWEGVGIALLASVLSSIGFFALTFLFSENCAIRMLISGLTTAYIFYLFSRSKERIGRLTITFSWFLLLGTIWFFYPFFGLFLTSHLIAVWLIRSLYFYTRLLSSLADLGLNALSIASAFWALHHTNSLFLTFWCFFLVQALFIYIPTGIEGLNTDDTILSNSKTDFNRAYQAAEAAARKLSTHH